MKALSLYPYYAMKILRGYKTIECRTWQTKYRGDLLICAGARETEGCISRHAVCVVNLRDIQRLQPGECEAAAILPEDYRPYYGWRIEDIRLIEPFPVRGRMSLFNVDHEVRVLCDINREREKAEAVFKNYYLPLIDPDGAESWKAVYGDAAFFFSKNS